MSLDELRHTTLETIWCEYKVDNKLTQFNKEGIAALFFIGTSFNWLNYNKTWRIWNTEPTAEQMKEAPWDCD